MSLDPVFDPLYRIDKFLRFELTNTLQSGGTLEPAKAWSVVSDSFHQVLVEQRTNLQWKELKHLEGASTELQTNLNVIAQVFREIDLVKGTSAFDEQRYLDQANAAINRAQQGFQTKLSEFEKLRPRNVQPDFESKPRADRIIDTLKNNRIIAILFVLGVIIIGIGSLTDAMDKIQKLFTMQPRHTVSINCSHVVIPLPGEPGGSLYAVYLHPQWGNRLASAPSTSWPPWATPKDGAYRCEVLNNGEVALYGLSIVFLVTFREEAALPPKREITIPFPESVETHRSMVFYIADDTRHAREVLPPESVSARVGDEKERRMIPVRYSTLDGRPMPLRGFNP